MAMIENVAIDRRDSLIYHNPQKIPTNDMEIAGLQWATKHDMRPCSLCYPQRAAQDKERRTQAILDMYNRTYEPIEVEVGR